MNYGIKIPGGYFDEGPHLYRNEKGVIVPSATQVFDILDMIDFDRVPKAVLEWKQNYGLAVHKAVQFLKGDDLDWDSVDEAIIPAVTGVEQYLKEIKFEWISAEEVLVYTLDGMEVGMTVDLYGTAIYRGVRKELVIDLKSGVDVSPTWKWQVGGYGRAKGVLNGIVVQFDKEGKVTPHYVDCFQSGREFQTLLAAAILKLNNGLYTLGGSNGSINRN